MEGSAPRGTCWFALGQHRPSRDTSTRDHWMGATSFPVIRADLSERDTKILRGPRDSAAMRSLPKAHHACR